jgi:hypothetical protein
MRITRRQVLAAMGATAAAAVVGAGAVRAAWWDRPPGAGVKALSDGEHRFAQSLAEAWMPRGGDPPLSGSDANLGAYLDEIVAALDAPPRRQLKLLLHGLDCSTLPTHLSTYHALDLEPRAALLHGWLDSDNYLERSAIQAVMVLMALGWSTHPDVVGIVRPWFGCTYGR